MDGIQNENQKEAAFSASVPPPPPEVKIRTLESDIESITQSGGVATMPRLVKAPPIVDKTDLGAKKAKPSSGAAGIIIAAVAFIVFAAAAFVAYKYLSAIIGGNANPGSNSPSAATTTQTPAAPASASISSTFVHRSAFRKPPDQTFMLSVVSAATNASELQTFYQRLNNLLSSASPTSTFFEIDVKGNDGRDININEIFSLSDGAVLDPQLLSDNFSLDATFFVYKDKNGFWPGYVLALQSSKNWLFLKDDVAKLESSPKIRNLFLSSPGEPLAPGFKDDTADDQPIRVEVFSAPGASFSYGWYHGYLILSTSEDGFKQALARL
jgi:hypothetical protein